jgi:hypothetical protein
MVPWGKGAGGTGLGLLAVMLLLEVFRWEGEVVLWVTAHKGWPHLRGELCVLTS